MWQCEYICCVFFGPSWRNGSLSVILWAFSRMVTKDSATNRGTTRRCCMHSINSFSPSVIATHRIFNNTRRISKQLQPRAVCANNDGRLWSKFAWDSNAQSNMINIMCEITQSHNPRMCSEAFVCLSSPLCCPTYTCRHCIHQPVLPYPLM